jgi:hypothetical protein
MPYTANNQRNIKVHNMKYDDYFEIFTNSVNITWTLPKPDKPEPKRVIRQRNFLTQRTQSPILCELCENSLCPLC